MLTAPPCTQRLRIDYNHLRGPLPTGLFRSLPRLALFAADHNGLTGTLPPDLHLPDSLEMLTLGSNMLRGTLPPALQFGRLQTLHLGDNLVRQVLGGGHRLALTATVRPACSLHSFHRHHSTLAACSFEAEDQTAAGDESICCFPPWLSAVHRHAAVLDVFINPSSPGIERQPLPSWQPAYCLEVACELAATISVQLLAQRDYSCSVQTATTTDGVQPRLQPLVRPAASQLDSARDTAVPWVGRWFGGLTDWFNDGLQTTPRVLGKRCAPQWACLLSPANHSATLHSLHCPTG